MQKGRSPSRGGRGLHPEMGFLSMVGVSVQRGYPYPPHLNRMIHASENITFSCGWQKFKAIMDLGGQLKDVSPLNPIFTTFYALFGKFGGRIGWPPLQKSLDLPF